MSPYYFIESQESIPAIEINDNIGNKSVPFIIVAEGLSMVQVSILLTVKPQKANLEHRLPLACGDE